VAGINRTRISAKTGAGAQFRAIAWIRWRLFLNAFRRKGGKGELVARVLLFPFLAAIAMGPIAAAGFGGYYAIHAQSAVVLSIVTWAVFAGWVFVMSATTLSPGNIDLSLLLRFPMRLSSYVVMRFFFGLLATPNVVGGLALAAAVVGIGIARPRLLPWAALVLFCYALMTVLLMRMVLLWLDRWLAQRRTREIVGVVFTLFFLAFQFVNVEMQNWTHHRGGPAMLARIAFLMPVYHAVRPVAAALPPSLAAGSMTQMRGGHVLAATGMLGGLLVYTAGFAALFVLRLRGEFRGENFNEAPKREQTAKAGAKQATDGFQIGVLPTAVAACVEKELRYMVRGPSLLLSVLMPLVLVGLYANRMGSSEFLLPGAMAYTLFSLLPMLYNVLGGDAAGAQMYLLSPTPIRTVFLAKNLVQGTLIVLVASGAAALVCYSNAPSAPIAVGTAIWFLFVLFANLSFGNYRSIHSPIKIDLGKVQRRQGGSQLSTFIVLGVLFGSLLAGFAVLWGCRYLGHIWAAPAVLLAMAMAAMAVYVRSLGRIGRVVLEQRDGLIEVLCKG
jgi:ABC-2 type transport system permease protein